MAPDADATNRHGGQFEQDIARELPQLQIQHRRELARALERLTTALQPERIYAFGSFARGTAVHEFSDVDLLVVLPQSDEPDYRRAQQAYLAVGSHDLPLDIVVLTAEEFEARSSDEWSVQAEVRRDGRLLYAA